MGALGGVFLVGPWGFEGFRVSGFRGLGYKVSGFRVSGFRV